MRGLYRAVRFTNGATLWPCLALPWLAQGRCGSLILHGSFIFQATHTRARIDADVGRNEHVIVVGKKKWPGEGGGKGRAKGKKEEKGVSGPAWSEGCGSSALISTPNFRQQRHHDTARFIYKHTY